MTAYEVAIPVRVTDEELTIRFRTDRNYAKVSAIVVEVDEEAPPAEVVFAVNAGGPAYVDAAGTLYEADTQFSGGAPLAARPPLPVPMMMCCIRASALATLPTTSRCPTATMWSPCTLPNFTGLQAGQRLFDVEIEGTEVVSNLDLVATVGTKTAHEVAIPVRVTDGELNISFHTDRNNAKVSAIRIEAGGETP